MLDLGWCRKSGKNRQLRVEREKQLICGHERIKDHGNNTKSV